MIRRPGGFPVRFFKGNRLWRRITRTMIKLRSTLSLVAALSALTFTAALSAQHHGGQDNSQSAPASAGKLVPITEKEAAWAAGASKEYPLNVCVASGEKLGSMGDATEWIYRAEGQADRLVKFCCDGCIDTFMENPAEHLAKIDAAAKKNSPKNDGAKSSHGHE